MQLPIVAPAPIVTAQADILRALCEHRCQFRHFQHYLTGLIVLADQSEAPRTLINSLESCSATLAYFLGSTEVSTHRLGSVQVMLHALRTHSPAFTGFLRTSV